MRLLVTTDAVGGVWTYALDLAAGLARRGDEVALAVLGPPPGDGQRRAARELPGVSVHELGGALDWTAAGVAELKASACDVAALARRLDVDVVHLNSPALAAYARFDAPVVGVAHSCLATWWEAVEPGAPPDDLAWRIAATAQGYRRCDALIAPSTAFAAATERVYGVTPIVVRNGRAMPSRQTSPKARTIPVATAGRLWDRGKGAAVLDAAAAALAVPILAMGPTTGPQGDVIGLAHLQLDGPRPADAVAATLARTRVFASAALYEPFGLAVLEAAQAGCALVLSDIATLRELWDGAAVFAPPGDPGAFAAAIDRLLSDRPARQRLARAARARAARYDLDSFVAATAAVHRTVLRLPAKASANAGAAA